MKRLLILALLCALISSSAYAVTAPTEEDYNDLHVLRKKLIRMKQEMDNFMKDLVVASQPQTGVFLEEFGYGVRVDVFDGEKAVTVKADLPGMDKDKIEIALEGDRIMKISGSRDVLKKEASPGLVKQERMQGRFERVLELPAACLNEGIDASYKNGVLEIVIPKKEKPKEETVKIKVQ